MIYARQSTAIIVTVGPVLDADGVAVTGGVVGDFKASKNGGAPAALNGSATLTHRNTGHYSLSLTATDVNTVGTLEIVIDDTVNACPIKEIHVLEEAVYDALFAASANAWAGAAGSSVAGANVLQLLGTAWLTPGTAGTPDVNVKLWNALTTVALPLVPTTAGRTLDVSATGETGIDWANVGTPGSTVNLSATTINLVNTATTVTNQLTAAAIATGVWQDATAGDFTVASSIGKALYIANIVPGASGGHFIAGSNAGTTTFGALTVTGATTLTGAVSATNASNDIVGIDVAKLSGDATAANNLESLLDGTGGITLVASAFTLTTPITANATQISGDSAAADNLELAFDDTAGAVPWTNIVDQGTAQAATGTTIQLRAAAGFADDELIGSRVLITGGSAGVGQSRLITDYVSATDTATVATWTTTPTGTITYKIFSDTAAAGGSAPTAGEVADAVWDEARAGHVAAGSFGENVLAKDHAGASLATASALDTVDNFLDTEIADIQSRLPAALTADGNMKSDALRFGGTLYATALAAEVDAVWDEDATAHQTQGTFGQAIGDPASDSDSIWALVNTNLNATVSSRSSHNVGDIWAAAARTLTALDEDSTTLDLDATIRAAMGLASANLDTQLADLPTVAEFEARTLVAASYATNADLDALIATVGVAGAGLTEAGGDGDHLTAINLPNQTMDIVGNITGNLSGSVGSVTVTTGYKLASDGLDSIATTAPAGVAANFREMLVQVWRRFFKRVTKDSDEIKTYADNGTSVVTTQVYTSAGDDDDVGAAT
jgi:hypothetical protein